MGDHIPKWAVDPPYSSKSRLDLVTVPVGNSESAAEKWLLRKAAHLLGRNGQAVDICVAHKSASRVHACLAYDASGDLYLVDLGSAHGTFLNGERLEQHGKARVMSGDRIICAACPTEYMLATPDHTSNATVDPERDSLAANGAATGPGPVHSDGSERQGTGRGDAADQRQNEREAQDAPGKHGPDRQGARSRRPRSRSSERAEARHGGRQQHGDRARRSPADSRHAGGGPRDRRGPAGHVRHRHGAPVPHRPSPLPSRPQGTSREQRSRRSASPAAGRRRRRPSRSRSRSPARHRKRERDESSTAQKQRERQAAFKDPLAPAPAPAPAGNPIDIVRAMMGVPAGGSGFAVEQKKKLLWGSKKAEAPVQGTVAGHNRWDTAEFTSGADKDKFQRLMGVKHTGPVGPSTMPTDGQLFDRHVPQRDQQERLEGDLERNFLEGVRRGTRGAVGLGL